MLCTSDMGNFLPISSFVPLSGQIPIRLGCVFRTCVIRTYVFRTCMIRTCDVQTIIITATFEELFSRIKMTPSHIKMALMWLVGCSVTLYCVDIDF